MGWGGETIGNRAEVYAHTQSCMICFKKKHFQFESFFSKNERMTYTIT